VILLDAPGEVLFERKGEHTAVWLEEQRQRYLALRERIPHLYVVDASQPAEQVKNEAIDLIWKHVAAQINLRKYGNRTT
jgi:thymidylate kinase